MTFRTATCFASLLLLTACGAAQTTALDRPPPVVLHETDFGRTLRVTQGQTLNLELTDRRPFPGSSTVWEATSSDPRILELTAHQHSATAPARDGTYTASLVAKATGTARILLVGATTCEAMAKSSCPDQAAQISIEVSK